MVALTANDLADIAVEWWRLDRWAEGDDDSRLVARHVARRISRVLESRAVQVLDLVGKEYEPGLAVEVLDTVVGPTGPGGSDFVDETIAPIVLLNGHVIRQGQVVTRRGA